MNKPRWISFFGWFTLALAMLAATAAVMGRRGPRALMPATVAAVAVLLGCPAAGLWLLASAAYRIRTDAARVRARVAAEGGATSGGVRCASCGKLPAMLTCATHAVALCPGCWATHHTPECVLARPAPPPPRAVPMVR